MAIKIPIVKTSDKDLSLFQTQLAKALQPLLIIPLTNGRLIQGVSLTTGQTIVNHGLNRKLIGWFLTRQSANANIWDGQALNPNPEVSLYLESTGDVLVDVWVF